MFGCVCPDLMYLAYFEGDDMQAVLKEIDEQGRIEIPAKWRKKWPRGTKVILRDRGEILEIIPQARVDLTAFFDRAEIDTKADPLELARSAQDLAEEVESPKRKPSRSSSWEARRRERSTRSRATTIASTKSTESPNRRI